MRAKNGNKYPHMCLILQGGKEGNRQNAALSCVGVGLIIRLCHSCTLFISSHYQSMHYNDISQVIPKFRAKYERKLQKLEAESIIASSLSITICRTQASGSTKVVIFLDSTSRNTLAP
jgi:hypothetical protein